MSKQDIADYVFKTPHNTNPVILNQKLDELVEESGGGGGGESATEPYIEETYDSNGNLVNANLVGYTKVRNYQFYNCQYLSSISLPSEIISIGDYAFYNCSNLALTSLPSEITSIGTNSFRGCSNLALTSLPSGITTIQSSGFNGCIKLALTSLPSGIESIESYAFSLCTGLTSITFEGTPKSIDSTAFYKCTNLTAINVPWEENAVANAPWGATKATIIYAKKSEDEILSETTFTFGDNSFPFGDYLMSENSASANLVEGKTYIVTMDGNDYNRTAYANSNINGFICLDIDSTFSYANGYMLSNDLSYAGSKTISIKLVS